MKKSIFTLVVIALFALVFTSCDNVAVPTTETPAADTAKAVAVDTCAVSTCTAAVETCTAK